MGNYHLACLLVVNIRGVDHATRELAAGQRHRMNNDERKEADQ